MVCAKCGKENAASARFCFSCGSQLAAPAAPPPPYPTPAAPVQNYGTPPPPPAYSSAPPQYYPPAYPPQAPGAYPPPQAPGAYPQQMPGPYPSQANQYRYAPTQKAGGAGIAGRLPMLGAVLAAAGFFLAWETSVGVSGWDIMLASFKSIGSLGTIDLSDIYAAQLLLMVGLMIGLVLILVAALFGLLTVIGKRGIRTAAVVLSVLALADLLGLYGYILWDSGGLETVLPNIGIGWYLVVGGLLWMIITPLFARKS